MTVFCYNIYYWERWIQYLPECTFPGFIPYKRERVLVEKYENEAVLEYGIVGMMSNYYFYPYKVSKENIKNFLKSHHQTTCSLNIVKCTQHIWQAPGSLWFNSLCYNAIEPNCNIKIDSYS